MTIQPDPSHGAVVLHDRVPDFIAAYRSGWHSLQGGYGTALLIGLPPPGRPKFSLPKPFHANFGEF